MNEKERLDSLYADCKKIFILPYTCKVDDEYYFMCCSNLYYSKLRMRQLTNIYTGNFQYCYDIEDLFEQLLFNYYVNYGRNKLMLGINLMPDEPRDHALAVIDNYDFLSRTIDPDIYKYEQIVIDNNLEENSLKENIPKENKIIENGNRKIFII